MTIMGVIVTLTEAEEVLREAPVRLGVERCFRLLAEGLGREQVRHRRETHRIGDALAGIAAILDDMEDEK